MVNEQLRQKLTKIIASSPKPQATSSWLQDFYKQLGLEAGSLKPSAA